MKKYHANISQIDGKSKKKTVFFHFGNILYIFLYNIYLSLHYKFRIMNNTDKNKIMPAEWEHQWGIQLTWPHGATDWNYCLDDICRTYVEMADVITRYEHLLIVTPDIEFVSQQLSARLSEQQMASIVFHKCPTNDTWARDHGFITVIDGDEKHLVDFKFNGWGEKFAADKDTRINASLYKSGLVKGCYTDCNDFVLEGGSIESDGCGTVFTTSMCLLAPHRNQPMTQTDIENKLKETLGAERVMWIDHGSLVGDDTDGHIDTIVRVAPNDTLIYVGCDDKDDCQYEDFRQLEEQLKTFLTADGRSYNLVRLPMPDAICEDGERLPATYANYLIINGAVIVPTYAQKEKDDEAMRLIAGVFPGRQIIGVDSRVIIRQHGSVHCCTMQFYED